MFRVLTPSRTSAFLTRGFSSSAEGVQFVNVANPEAKQASLGLYIGVGTRHETRDNTGATQLLKQMSFKSTKTRPQLQVCRDLELLGASVTATSSREYLYLSASVPQSESLETETYILNHFYEFLAKQKLSHWEVRDQKPFVKLESQELKQNLQFQISENLHRLSFRHSNNNNNQNKSNFGLATSLAVDDAAVDRLNEHVLASWIEKHFVGGNVVVSWTGVRQAERFEKVASDLFGNVKRGNTHSTPTNASAPVSSSSSPFSGGGEHLVDLQGVDETFVGIGFQGAGLTDGGDFWATSVLEQLLGGGRRGSSGVVDLAGSKLDTLTLNNSNWLNETSAFNFSYVGTGLFGLYGRGQNSKDKANANQIVSTLLYELLKIAEGKFDDTELTGAKLATARAALSSYADLPELKLRIAATDKLVQSNLLDVKSEVAKVSRDQIITLAKRLLSSKPNLVVFGDLTNVAHSYDVISHLTA